MLWLKSEHADQDDHAEHAENADQAEPGKNPDQVDHTDQVEQTKDDAHAHADQTEQDAYTHDHAVLCVAYLIQHDGPHHVRESVHHAWRVRQLRVR